MDSEVEAFLQAIEAEPEVWRSCDLRVAAARLQGRWTVLSARLQITGRDPDACPRMPYGLDVETAFIGQECRPASDLRTLLEHVAAGTLRAHGREFAFTARQEMGTPNLSPIRWYRQSRTLEDIYGHGGYQWPAALLIGEGASTSTLHSSHEELREQLARVAREQSGPFLEFTPRAQAALGYSDRGIFGSSCAIECEARHELRVLRDRLSVVDGTLTLALLAGSRAAITTAGVEVEVTRHESRDVSTPVIALPEQWTKTPEGLLWEARMPVGDCDRVAVTVRCGREKTEVRGTRPYRVAGGSVFVNAYRVLDPGLEALHDTLFKRAPGKVSASDFEDAVARLFVLNGWHADRIANKALQQNVDVVAHAPALQLLLAIECTTGAPSNNGKHATLHARCGDLHNALPGIKIRGVLATRLHESQVLQGDREALRENGLLLCDRDDLLKLAELAGNGGGVGASLQVLLDSATRRDNTVRITQFRQ
jgi:hypothetical protein